MQKAMKEKDEIITVRVKKSKAKAFRDMLKLFDFIKLETPEEKINRYIRTVPKDVPLSDDDIMDLTKE
jgi:hypothetical protein